MVDAIHLGPQKAATTWVYQCLLEHPDAVVARTDAVHYYDMFYHRSYEWYRQQFPDDSTGKIRVDMTPSYLRSPEAPERIARDLSDVKLIMCLRNPIERAFSHYWHEKKKGRFNYTFSEALENYDLYASWLEPGFYGRHLTRYLEYFDRKQILIQHYDDLVTNPRLFLRQLLEFIGVSAEFVPSVLSVNVNQAKPRSSALRRRAVDTIRWAGALNGALAVREYVRRSKLRRWMPNFEHRKMEYLSDVPRSTQARIVELYARDVEEVERMLGWDLSTWREAGGAGGR